MRSLLLLLCLVSSACGAPALNAQSSAEAAADPLPSWNDGIARRTLVDFVTRTTRPDAPDSVPPAERIAVFDNDGTLWVEQPMYTQFAFALDRINALAPAHPEWKTTPPFAAIFNNDMKTVFGSGEAGLMRIIAASHTGITTAEFEAIVREWITSARHPRTRRRYDEMVYQPMLEVLAYLRANGYKTYIVSGGGVEFIRPWAERVYGVPPEQVIGSRVKVKYERRDGMPVLLRLPEIDLNDDKSGKPIGIQQAIGRRPVIAFGNSDGDFHMLEWTTSAPGPRLGVIVHHTDAAREWAYDRDSQVGRLARALDEAPGRGWLVVDMKNDWKAIYPAKH
jgi:phosphoglycolate phosphatase-like HAD superfamily hydrolase